MVSMLKKKFTTFDFSVIPPTTRRHVAKGRQREETIGTASPGKYIILWKGTRPYNIGSIMIPGKRAGQSNREDGQQHGMAA